MAEFGELLRRLRGNRTQREVANDLGMPVTTLSTLENQNDVPRGPVLKQLCEFYGVPSSYFYGDRTGKMKNTESAREWLRLVRENAAQKEKIAFSGPLDISPALEKQISDKLREKKNAEVTDIE